MPPFLEEVSLVGFESLHYKEGDGEGEKAQLLPNLLVPNINEEWVNSLWDVIQRAKSRKGFSPKSPN